MSGEDYTPAGATFPAFPWALVKDGEVYNFDSIQKSGDPKKGLFAKCMDGIAYCYNSLTTASARVDAISGGTAGSSITRTSSQPGQTISGTWSLQATGNYSTGAATACVLNMPLSAEVLPHGATLTAVSISILPAAHASIVGLTLPTVALYSYDLAVGSTQIGATTSDTSASAVAYSALHAVAITGLSTVIDRTTKRYFLQFTSEISGANAASGTVVLGASVTRTAL